MADSDRPIRVPWWVNLADGATLVLLAVAALIAVTGGFRHYVAGVFVSVTSAWRPLLVAVLVAALRHAVHPRATLAHRVAAAARWTVRGVRHAAVGTWSAATAATRAAGRACSRALHPPPLRPADEARFAAPCPPAASRAGVRELVLVGLLMASLTALIFHRQVARLDAVPDLGDPLFSIWRLSWIAHQLPRDPLHLFDGNVFYPEAHTLAFSDSILLPGVAAAPFLWLGVPKVPFYNLYVLATFVLSGVAMYALVRALTQRRSAALVAGVLFAFYPFRIEHYSHFELQFSFWMPLALLALHRAVTGGRLRDGLLAGGALAGQMLSCVYFAVFLAAYMVPVWLALAVAWRRVRASVVPLLAGAALAVLLVAPMVLAHLQARQSAGDRTTAEMVFYSATGRNYLTPHVRQATWADAIHLKREPERELFPGLLIVALALVAVWPPLSAARIAYTVALVFAFEASLGFNGYLYPLLRDWVLPFRGLRVPARYSMLVGLSLSILAGYGTARLAALVRRPWFGPCLAAVLVAAAAFESRTALDLERVLPVHPVYEWFAGRPTSVIADLPMPGARTEDLWKDAKFMYASTAHWQRIVNGNSGYLPPSYVRLSAAMTTFPDDASMRLLRQHGVQYVVVHEMYYGHLPFRALVAEIERRPDLREVYRAPVGNAQSRIYRLLPRPEDGNALSIAGR